MQIPTKSEKEYVNFPQQIFGLKGTGQISYQISIKVFLWISWFMKSYYYITICLSTSSVKYFR